MNGCLAISPKDLAKAERPLARTAQLETFGNVGNPIHRVSPSLVQSTWTEGGEMYSAPKEKFSTRDEHLMRVAAALNRRLYPNTPLHQKVLGDAIGVTRHTVNNWVRMKCDPGSHEMQRLGRFFKSTEGCAAFLIEIYGDLGEAMANRSAAE